MALYRAKSSGRNCFCFFDPEMSAAASVRHELETELRRAIQQDQFELYYQPIIDSKSRKICGAEALVRWNNPTKGMISPDKFIPLAEESGLITQIGEWVLQTACAEAVKWPSQVRVSVNLSPVQLRKRDLVDVVICALAQSGLPPERLELEVTETALIESATDSLTVLRQLKNLGVSIALDDFGTGYSSLSHLTMFPFDKIKIDKSFTQNLTKRADCARARHQHHGRRRRNGRSVQASADGRRDIRSGLSVLQTDARRADRLRRRLQGSRNHARGLVLRATCLV
jgi:predicted signal transduction protein with EAL and GGDEF domain